MITSDRKSGVLSISSRTAKVGTCMRNVGMLPVESQSAFTNNKVQISVPPNCLTNGNFRLASCFRLLITCRLRFSLCTEGIQK